MINYISEIITSHEEFLKFARSERDRFENPDENRVYNLEIKADYEEIEKILNDTIRARNEGEDSHKRFIDSILFRFHLLTDNIGDVFKNLIDKEKDYIFISDVDGDTGIVLYNSGETIHPLIPRFLALPKSSNIYRNIIVKFSASLIKISEEEETTKKGKASDIMDITVIHKYLLLCNKYIDNYDLFEIIISMPYYSKDNVIGDQFRLGALVSNLDPNKVKVYLDTNKSNGDSIFAPIEVAINRESINYGMLLPAVYIEKEDYYFLKRPINQKLWDEIINGTLNMGAGNKFRAYLEVCRRSLFEEFDDNNESAVYTTLRKDAYSSDLFYEKYVSRIPFFALFLFALYDNHYRSECLRKYKGLIKGDYELTEQDCYLYLQGEQARSRYDKYQEIKNEYDIKNLIDYNNGEMVFQNTVDAEILECVSIAEGLLQLCENAVLHAGGGLLSMRIYNRGVGVQGNKPLRPHNVAYLNEVYGKSYFDYLKSSFYLEVQLSDFSNSSMPEKFIENIEKKYNDISEEFKEKFSEYLSNEDGFKSLKQRIKLDFFFSDPKPDTIKPLNGEKQISLYEFKQWYYNRESVVHHYGLETFNGIITAKNGIFSVCGYNDSYSNVDDITKRTFDKTETKIKMMENDPDINNYLAELKKTVEKTKDESEQKLKETLEKDKALPGAIYRILLPLNHNRTTNSRVDNMPEKKDEILSSMCDTVDIFDGPEELFQESESVKKKQEKIEVFAKYIYQKYYGKVVSNGQDQSDTIWITCIDADSIKCSKANVNTHAADLFESMIKGTLRYALTLSKRDNLCVPIALVNLTPFEFIEAARIITIFYTRGSLFEKIPIYLKCKEPSKEMTFSESDLQAVKNNVLRTAMKSGTMFDELYVIISILANKPDMEKWRLTV